jgi:hypothetical protein
MNAQRVAQRLGVVAVLLGVGGAVVGAQGLARRVQQTNDGTVRFSFAAKHGVCGNGRGNVTTNYNSRTGTVRGREEWEDECEPGPVRVALDVVSGKVIAARTYVGGKWKATGDVVDVGTVSVREATDFLLDVAARGSGRGARDAIFPATIADSIEVWPRLLTIAKDDDRERDVRTQAVFWVSQAAGERATVGLTEIVGDVNGDREVRKQAVFALSQRPRAESTPALINVARTSKDPELRRSAIFWLGQSKDPKAIEYFESVLLKR